MKLQRPQFGPGQGQPGATVQDRITGSLHTEEVVAHLEAHRKRRERLLRKQPDDLLDGAIWTVERRKGENQYTLSKYPVWYIKGIVGKDYVTAYLNCNPRASLVPFYVNGEASDFMPGHYKNHPVYNMKTGKITLVFEEDAFMAQAIRVWLQDEYKIVSQKP